MKKTLKTLASFIGISIFIFFLLILSYPVALITLYESLEANFTFERNINKDSRCRYFLGNQFILKEDAYLYAFNDSKKLLIGNLRGTWQIGNEPPTRFPSCIEIKEIIKKSTIITISKITKEVSPFGVESRRQIVYATINNGNGSTIEADVSELFRYPYFSPDEEWIFQPDFDCLEVFQQ